jgi:sugar/nucleoside kinase (ribokinase family)
LASPGVGVNPDPLPITVLGSVALDTIETPRGRRDRLLGGSATHFAAAARLCAPVSIVGAVGEDFLAAEEEALVALGVDLSALARLPGRTYAWHGRYGADFANATTVERHVGVVDDHLPAAVGATGCLFLGAMDPVIQRHALDSSPAVKLSALDSRESWIAESPELVLELCGRTDFVILNAFELAALTGRESTDEGIAALLEAGAGSVIVKRGAEGASLHSGEQTISVPAPPVELIDPTGAGDAFAGGFLGALAETGTGTPDLAAALRLGAAMAAFALEGFGIEALVEVTREEVDARAAAIKTKEQ